jgi:hypothetical protein
MFGRASSRPVQKLETDPGIAIVPCEVLSKGAPETKKIHLLSWSVEMHSWFDKMRSLFRVVNPGSCGVTKLFQAARSFCAGSYGPAPVLLPRPKGGAGRPRLFDKDFQPGHAEVSPGVLSRKSIKHQLNQ